MANIGAVIVDTDRHLRVFRQVADLVTVLLDTAHHDVVVFNDIKHRCDNRISPPVDVGHLAIGIFPE